MLGLADVGHRKLQFLLPLVHIRQGLIAGLPVGSTGGWTRKGSHKQNIREAPHGGWGQSDPQGLGKGDEPGTALALLHLQGPEALGMPGTGGSWEAEQTAGSQRPDCRGGVGAGRSQGG